MRLTALIAVVGAAIIAGALYLQSGRADGTCHAYEARTVVSPDGKMRAKIFKRDCGATTAELIQVSVLSRDVAEDDAPGNAFTSELPDGLPSGSVMAAMNARWTAPDRLEIHYDGRLRVFEQHSAVHGVAIRDVPEPFSGNGG